MILINIVQLVCLLYYDKWYYTIPASFVFLYVCVLVDHLCVSKLSFRELGLYQVYARLAEVCCGVVQSYDEIV